MKIRNRKVNKEVLFVKFLLLFFICSYVLAFVFADGTGVRAIKREEHTSDFLNRFDFLWNFCFVVSGLSFSCLVNISDILKLLKVQKKQYVLYIVLLGVLFLLSLGLLFYLEQTL